MRGSRVVITGMGWVTPLGRGIDAVWSRLLAGESAVRTVSHFDASTFATNFAAEVEPFDLGSVMPAGERYAHAASNSRYALAAAWSAWTHAQLDRSPAADLSRAGMYMGCGEGSLDYDAFFGAHLRGWDAQAKSVNEQRWLDASRDLHTAVGELEQEPHMPLRHLAEVFGLRGPAFNCMTACAASTQSVGEASEIIRRGDADVMLAGGAHSMIHPLGMTGFIRLTAMSKRRNDPSGAARPFDRTRDGFVMGEGAGVLVLESAEHAHRRGVEPLAEVAGYGATADAFRITDIQPQGMGAQRCMRQALHQAGIDPAQRGPDGRPIVHYISAHGTGTQENDAIETAAVKGVFGPLAPDIPFSSVKSMMGHLIQAAGVVELMTCVQAIRTGWVPPTINLNEPDPDCDLDYVPHKARDLRGVGGVRVCLSNGFGFGGQNNTVCVRAWNAPGSR